MDVPPAPRRSNASSNWCFTWNNPPSLPQYLGWDTSVLKLLVYQFEVGESGTRHVQGYVELKSRRTLAGIKSLLNAHGVHFETRKGTRQQAIEYAMKEDTREQGTEYNYFEDLTVPVFDLTQE